MTEQRQHEKDEVMNADEASAGLKIPKSTLYKLRSDAGLPAAKAGRHWRFHRDTLERGILDKTCHGPKEEESPVHQQG